MGTRRPSGRGRHPRFETGLLDQIVAHRHPIDVVDLVALKAASETAAAAQERGILQIRPGQSVGGLAEIVMQ